MKKLMMAAVAVAMCAAANAATVSWSASSIAASPDTERTTRSDYMAYLFDSTASTYADVIAAVAKGNMSVLSEAKSSKAVGATGSIIGASWASAPYSEGDYVKGFAVILNDSTPGEATYYMATPEVTSAKAVSSSGAVTLGFGSQASNTWQSIPEPTSGLLLLLGVAGLALRRRRA